MKKISDQEYQEIGVVDYEIVDTYLPSETSSLNLLLESGEEVRILAPYFAHMQMPSFVEEISNEIGEEL